MSSARYIHVPVTGQWLFLAARGRIGGRFTSEGRPGMPETPTFGRYAEIPYDEMTPEQQEGFRSLLETRGALGGPNRV